MIKHALKTTHISKGRYQFTYGEFSDVAWNNDINGGWQLDADASITDPAVIAVNANAPYKALKELKHAYTLWAEKQDGAEPEPKRDRFHDERLRYPHNCIDPKLRKQLTPLGVLVDIYEWVCDNIPIGDPFRTDVYDCLKRECPDILTRYEENDNVGTESNTTQQTEKVFRITRGTNNSGPPRKTIRSGPPKHTPCPF